MNNLVAYGSDDDVSPRSHPSPNPLLPPNRGTAPEDSRDSADSGDDGRRRRDSDYFDDDIGDDDEYRNRGSRSGSETADGFVEPPPPRRKETAEEHSPSLSPSLLVGRGMTKNESTASLGRFQKDTFDREDERIAADSQGDDEDSRQPGSSEEEPAPPMRQPTADEEEDYEEAIDRQLEECKDLLKVNDGSETGMSTPRYDPSPMRTEEGPATPAHLREAEDVAVEEEVRIPPAPDAPPNIDVCNRFHAMFEKKSSSRFSMNDYIKNQKNFRNPSIYESFIEKFGLKEAGSNFPPSLFDPEGFTEDCFYDKISEQQTLAMEKLKKRAQEKPKEMASDAPLAKKPKH